MTEANGAEGMDFQILKAAAGNGARARLGRLVLPGRHAMETPNFFAVTSRGVVPHLTPDTIEKYGHFSGVYLAMEDLVEKSQKTITRIPAACKIPAADGKRLHAFTGLPASTTTILGPRRIPAVRASIGNSDSYIQMFTSNGFQPLVNSDYITTIETLRPDIAIPMADMSYSAVKPAKGKGIRRMCERTEDWMAELHASLNLEHLRASNTSIFAPTLPVPYPMQWEYLERLSGDFLDKLSGLAIYDVDILTELSNYPSLIPLPRLSLDTPSNPHEVLRQISLGIDTFLLPFVNTVSDAGVALTFTLQPPPANPHATDDGADLLPLGTDLTAPENAASLAPIVADCTCNACATHHRAYLHHLLNAREMLAWTLLQIHNHHVVNEFLAAVRQSLASGPEKFAEDCRAFARAYEAVPPAGMGIRPRARGYHFKSEFGDEKRYKSSWKDLQGQDGETDEDRLAAVEGKLSRDQMETPLVPNDDADAGNLVGDGIGSVDRMTA